MTEKKSTYKILLEASKLYQPGQDGVKRYIEELLKEIYLLLNNEVDIQLDLLLGKHIVPIHNYYEINEKNEVVKKGTLYANEFTFFKEGVIMNILMMIFFFPALPFRQKILNIYQSRYYPVMLTMLTRLGKGKYSKLENKLNLYDLIHVPLPQNMMFFKEIDTSFLVTIHDTSHKLFPQYHTKDNINRSETGIKLSKEKKSNYIAVSASAKKDFEHHYGLEHIMMIHEGVNKNQFYPRNTNEEFKDENTIYQLEGKKYFLALGTLEPRKNLLGTIDAFIALEKETDEDIYLIVVGGKGWKNRKIKKQLKIKSDKIIFQGFIPNIHLRYFYIHAIALVYPSFYEGFGLPLLESMACGTPVIYGGNSAMEEIVNGAGLPVNAKDSNSIKTSLDRFLNDKFREKKSTKSIEIAFGFSWQNTSMKTLEHYNKIINKPSRKK